MEPKPLILLIEDDSHWIDYLSEVINKYWDVNLEKFNSFLLARERILRNPNNIDFLVTDVFTEEDGVGKEERIGLDLTEFLNNVNKKTVIIAVTAKKSIIKSVFGKYNILDIIYKQEFDEVAFVNLICTLIPSKIGVEVEPNPKEIDKEENKTINKPHSGSKGGYIIS